MAEPLTRNDTSPTPVRSQEWRSAVFLALVLAPILAVIVVAGYGFIVWMVQLFAGPPGSW